MAAVGGSPSLALEASWCRQYAEQAEREYAAMVDGLLAENDQLEALARLLARQLAVATGNSGTTTPTADATSVTEVVVSRVAELLRQGEELRKQREDQVIALQRDLREERLETQSLRRRLTEVLAEQTKTLITTKEEPGGTDLQTLQAACAREARCRELAEARCALIESSCQQAIDRLERELVAARSLPPALRSSMAQSRSSAAMDDEKALALEAQLLREREVHQQQLSIYSGYARDSSRSETATPVAAASRQPAAVPAARVEARPVAGETRESRAAALLALVSPVASLSQSSLSQQSKLTIEKVMSSASHPSASHPSASHPSASRVSSQQEKTCHEYDGQGSDDDDYGFEGYLERASVTSSGAFEKVYLELTNAVLCVKQERGSSEPVLAQTSLTSLARPAQIASGSMTASSTGPRCFTLEVLESPSAAVPEQWLFRCVSGRRAQQWIEAINLACGASKM